MAGSRKEVNLVSKEFQEQNCKGCYFANDAKVGTGKPCCTYASQLNIERGVCLTRRAMKAPGRVASCHTRRKLIYPDKED
jgi:hypothetical protein